MKKTLLSLIALFIATIGYSQTFIADGVSYEVITGTNNTVNAIDYNTSFGTQVVIPKTVTNPNTSSKYNVVGIGTDAFKDKNLTSLTLSEGLTTIGTRAFFINQISNLVIPNSVTTIQANAFAYNQLSSLDLGSGVTSIANQAFLNNQLTSVVIPSSIQGMGASIFYDNQITSVTIQDGVGNLGFNTFQNNPVTTVTSESIIPPTLDAAVFANRSTIDLIIPSNTTAVYVTNPGAQWTGFKSVTETVPVNVYIPDANFKAYLLGNSSINTNADTEIQITEAAAYTNSISCPNLGIADLTGIEYFVNITSLICHENNLTSLDISSHTALVTVSCYNNILSNLNITNTPSLEYLYLANNNLTSIDVSANTNLININVIGNNLTSLDMSSNANLTDLYVHGNDLTSLNAANGNNTNMNFIGTQNPNLSCIQVDDPVWSTANWTNIDPTASFSVNCSVALVNSITVQGQAGASTITSSGGTLQMEANVLPANADDPTYTWSVTNGTGSATINANGLLTAMTNGTVTVTATANDASGISGTLVVTISNQVTLVNSITVQGQAGATTITSSGGTLQMEANVLPANADDATYTWSVTNGTGSATINANGLLTAMTDGTVTVTATANDASGISGTLVVTISNQVSLVNSITVQAQTGANTITTAGGTLQMTATVLPANADDATYTWSVTNGTGSATISANGLLTAMTDGTVTVTATANDASGIIGTMLITISNQSVGIKELNIIHNLSIYPNPVYSQLTIDAEAKMEAITILDIMGKNVKTIIAPKHTIDVSDLTKGIYLLQIQTDKGLANKKFIKK